MAESVKLTMSDEVRRNARTAGVEAGFGDGVPSRTVLTSDGLNAAIDAAYAAGRADEALAADHVADMAAVADLARRSERERIVAWLRETYSPARMADRIEAGEHVVE